MRPFARVERGGADGIPIDVAQGKSFNVAWLPTTFWQSAVEGQYATENAFLIDRLLAEAGAIVVRQTNCSYMLADAQSYNDIYAPHC